jgi:hypothetical protein
MIAVSPAPTFPRGPTRRAAGALQLLEQGRGNQAKIADSGLQINPGSADADDPWQQPIARSLHRAPSSISRELKRMAWWL